MATRHLTAALLLAVSLTSCANPAPPTPDTTTIPPAPRTTITEDGTYHVNTEIRPGTYHTDGAENDATCYWARLDNKNTTLASKQVGPHIPQTVTIYPTDNAFSTGGCTWTLIELPH